MQLDIASLFWGQKGWLSEESACLPPMQPGFDSQTEFHMCVEFVVVVVTAVVVVDDDDVDDGS